MLNVKFLPGSDSQELPVCPLPDSWLEVYITVPSVNGFCRFNVFRQVLVDAVSGMWMIDLAGVFSIGRVMLFI
jgi:hypothetical protein